MRFSVPLKAVADITVADISRKGRIGSGVIFDFKLKDFAGY